jgi:hypothetical protein
MTQIIPIVDNNPLKRKTFQNESHILSLEGQDYERDRSKDIEPSKRIRFSLTSASNSNDATSNVSIEHGAFIVENDTVKRFRNQFISNKKRARKGYTSPSTSPSSYPVVSPNTNVFSYSPTSPCSSDSDIEIPTDALFENNENEQMIISSTKEEQMIVDTNHDWEFLPNHLLCLIFSFMNQPALIGSVFGVCTNWYNVAKNSKMLWRKIDFTGIRVQNMQDTLDFLNGLTLGIKVQKHVPSRSCMSTGWESDDEMDEQPDFPHVRAGLLSVQKTEYSQGLQLEQIFLDGEITLPKTCSRMTHENFKRLRQIYPRLTGLSLPPVDQIATSTNSQTSAQTTTTVPTGVKSISDSSLQQISLFPNIQQIRLSTHNRITDAGIDELTKRVHTLTAIQMDYCNKLTLQSFKNVIERSPQLRNISILNNTCQLDDSALVALSKHGRRIQELRADINLSAISLPVLQQFVSQCKKIKSLYIRVHRTEGGGGVTDMMGSVVSLLTSSLQSLESFTMICVADGICISLPKITNSKLRSLHLSKCETLVRPEINCSNLQNIFFDHCKEISGWKFSEQSISSIREIRLRSSALVGVNLSELLIQKAKNLKDLEIFDCKLPRQQLIIECLPLLEKMIIFMCNDLIELSINRCDRLHTLSIDVCMELKKIQLECPALETAQLFVLPQIQYPKLTEFDIRSDKLVTLNLQRAVMLQRASVDCSNLDSLNMAGCRDLTEINPLRCPKLDKFAIGSTRLDFANNQEISRALVRNCPLISMLSISNSPFLDDSVLGYMCANLAHLQALVISNCTMLRRPHIEGSSIKGIQMTDCPAMHRLSVSAANLTKLFLRNCPSISDDTLEDLPASCPHVRYLEVCNCENIKKPKISFEELSDLHFNKCKGLARPTLNCPKLKKLLFFSCDTFKQVIFETPSEQCAEVLFSDCPSVSDNLVSSLHESARNIQAIVFQKCDAIRRPSFQFANLKVLRFADCANLVMPVVLLSDRKLSIASFQDCKNLKFDENRLGTSISGRVEMVEFNNCENLSRLCIDCNVLRVSVQTCDGLQELTVNTGQKLQVLNCEGLTNLSVNVEDMTVRHCNELKTIQASAALHSIEITSCMRVSDICVTSLLNKCPDLIKMFITSCNVASPVIKHAKLASLAIRSCPNLERLKLEGTNLHEFLVHECPRLSESNIHYATAAARVNINSGITL